MRNFVKGLVSSPPKFNLPRQEFNTNIEILEFVKAYNPEIQLSVERVSLYKNRVIKLVRFKRRNKQKILSTLYLSDSRGFILPAFI